MAKKKPDINFNLKVSKNSKKITLEISSKDPITYDDIRQVVDVIENEEPRDRDSLN